MYTMHVGITDYIASVAISCKILCTDIGSILGYSACYLSTCTCIIDYIAPSSQAFLVIIMY